MSLLEPVEPIPVTRYRTTIPTLQPLRPIQLVRPRARTTITLSRRCSSYFCSDRQNKAEPTSDACVESSQGARAVRTATAFHSQCGLTKAAPDKGANVAPPSARYTTRVLCGHESVAAFRPSCCPKSGLTSRAADCPVAAIFQLGLRRSAFPLVVFCAQGGG